MTPSPSDLSALLARVEAAEGPDRELDGLIEVAARWQIAANVGLAPQHRARWQSGTLGQVYDGNTGYSSDQFTASIDAALALVERVLPGWDWSVSSDEGQRLGNIWPRGTYIGGHQGIAANPALALIAALLKALITQATNASNHGSSRAMSGGSPPVPAAKSDSALNLEGGHS